ncbi:hypothetical protein RHM65_04600 [Pseudomonas sp. CCI4.2]|uniref:hypothetical protein n=1 Tax=Pseudomonas sp. CCI4.2 TaxID=3048620 RepID=UPI002AC8B03E|nr:hypothetical protein [Pseudomonas sp. CCI4.2]WPX54863.1 hypothetical protein RHM65_04600 [Pseudomonas sp. CCI4.2]
MQNVKVVFAYKRGFRRFWVVASVIWLSLALAVFWGGPEFSMAFLEWGVAPVALVYAIGAATVWIIEGFARPD